MRTKLYQVHGQFKSFLFVVAICMVGGMLFYSQQIVENLRSEARGILEFYVQFYEKAVNSPNDDNLNFIFEEIIKRTDFPIILTDADGVPNSWKGLSIPSENPTPETIAKVQTMANAMRKEIEPLSLKYGDYVLGQLIYGDSSSVQQLRWLPYIELSAVGLFIMIGFFGFNSIRRSEQQFIWVGMAKETAHQLGTPISSLMGWSELLKAKCEGEPAKIEILDEIGQDIQRLDVAAQRFSQIGSKPAIKPENIAILFDAVIHYYNRRLPQMQRSVELEMRCELKDKIPINANLFQWVLENLVKNAIDAIGKKQGTITLEAIPLDGKYNVAIDITDNGRGMDSKTRKSVFRPGFSTKKRGWGLGLNLAKRIVEEYHGGKLFVKETQPDVGTTFRILL